MPMLEVDNRSTKEFLEDAGQGPVSGFVIADARIIDPCPTFLSQPEGIDVLPCSLQACGRHPFHSPFRCLVDETHLHPGRLLRPESANFHLHEWIYASSTVGMHVSDVHSTILQQGSSPASLPEAGGYPRLPRSPATSLGASARH